MAALVLLVVKEHINLHRNDEQKTKKERDMNIKSILSIIFTLAILLGYINSSFAAIVTITAHDRGFWDDSGWSDRSTSAPYDYHVGITNNMGEQNNYVLFDLQGYSGMEVVSASVSYYQNLLGMYVTSPRDLTLYDINTQYSDLSASGSGGWAPGQAIFNDLQSGQMLGSQAVYNTYPNWQSINVTLNSAGLADINANLGSLYGIGGTCNSCYLSTDYLLGASSLDGQAVLTLELEPISAVPVPAAVWLFGSGLFGLVGVARRKNS